LSVVRNCLLNIFAAALHNRRATRHAVVTKDPPNMANHFKKQLVLITLIFSLLSISNHNLFMTADVPHTCKDLFTVLSVLSDGGL
jgi:hypothetical protein